MTPPMDDRQPFMDRRDAGRVLASRLRSYAGRDDVVVLALPRGGVPVAYEVASALGAPLDVFLVRKLGTPGHRELAMGAIASGGVRVLNDDVVRWYGIPESAIESVAREETEELERREHAYRRDRPAPDLADRIVILVDDGLATGSTMRAAAQAVRAHGPSRVIVAVPVGARQTCSEIAAVADEVVCARTPEPFSAVGQWYVDFDQTDDGEVRDLLQKSSTTPQPSH
ncbi:MAG TPA: phosphoribosyltransferase [Vicinamibacterales bacterium]|nr:phosphoribosyltransferase [Vicinamibacterales bacterium]